MQAAREATCTRPYLDPSVMTSFIARKRQPLVILLLSDLNGEDRETGRQECGEGLRAANREGGTARVLTKLSPP